jgi:protein involved in polysaccharide export with SLBB domain
LQCSDCRRAWAFRLWHPRYDIDPNGVVSLPLAGTVRAVGLTQHEFEQELAKKFRSEYLSFPKILSGFGMAC